MRFPAVILATALLALPALATAADPGRLQLPDFTALAKKASQSVDISLDPSLLRLASGAISYDDDKNSSAVNELIKGIRGIYVRSYTFDGPGEYSKADVQAVRAQLLTPGWVAHRVDTRPETGEQCRYLHTAQRQSHRWRRDHRRAAAAADDRQHRRRDRSRQAGAAAGKVRRPQGRITMNGQAKDGATSPETH